MRTLSNIASEELPTNLPPAGAYLYGFINTNIEGQRKIRRNLTTYTLAGDIYRADEIPAALTTLGLPCSFDNGLFSIGTSSTESFRYTDRLGYLMGLARKAGSEQTDSLSGPRISSRISPIAIPLSGFSIKSHKIISEDEAENDRLMRDIGYVFGAARIIEVEVVLHKWALQALLQGWSMSGKVSFIGPNATNIALGNPEGSLHEVRILSVSEPSFLGQAQLWASLTFMVASL